MWKDLQMEIAYSLPKLILFLRSKSEFQCSKVLSHILLRTYNRSTFREKQALPRVRALIDR